jgi:hypothetical protein
MARQIIQQGHLWMFAFDPSDLGVVARVISPTDPNAVLPVRVSEALQQYGDLRAVVNGSQFGVASSERRYPAQGDTYSHSRKDLVLYRVLDHSAGIDCPGSKPHDGASLSVAGGIAHYYHGNQFAPGALVGIQGYPTMVYDGVVQETVRVGVVWMSATGILADGRVFIATSVSDIPEFAAALKALGAVFVIYGDDGTVTVAEHPEKRPVATLNACVDRSVLSGDDGRGAAGSTGTSGTGKVVAAAAVAAAAASLGAWAWVEWGPQVRRASSRWF